MIRRTFCAVKKMENLLPNKVLKHTDFLDKQLFVKKVFIPQIQLDQDFTNINDLKTILKPFFLKLENFRPMQNKKVLLNPSLVKSFEDLPVNKLKEILISPTNFTFDEVTLTYENWRCDDIVKAVLPEDLEPVTSFSRIGHIVHLNLKDHLIPYKKILGEIIRDKVVGCKTVINKAQTIDNTYRNFQIELLCGEPNFQVQVKENGSFFEFDFSQVYWNPRLSTEHERLVKMLNRDDVLYDVFAGVGPFSIPAGRKKVNVLANDLNPESHKWLAHNIKKNKVSEYVTSFMMDGREFIKSEIKKNLIERILNSEATEGNSYRIHVAMNLPAMAVEFLDTFVGLLKDNDHNITSLKSLPDPLVHVYCFVKGLDCDNKELAKLLAEENLKGHKIDKCIKEIAFVRNVAPNKDMMRVSFYLTNRILFDDSVCKRSSDESVLNSVPVKKLCKHL